MPELAEVEFYRKRWDLAARGQRVNAVSVHAGKKLFRGIDAHAIARALTGRRLADSEARAKQMLFRFGADVWLGIHLGMSGELTVSAPDQVPGKHDHLVIYTTPTGTPRRSEEAGAGKTSPRPKAPHNGHALVLTDPRMFGRVLLHVGNEPPTWWTRIAPPILSPAFTLATVGTFLRRRARSPIKAVLLMQERFPGVGNWMADEILWRSAIHPRRAAGSLSQAEIRRLWRECRAVCRLALRTIAGHGNTLPPDLNVNIPDSWLFNHRWQKGGRDPRTGTPLAHATIGGRTTCWSPARQREPATRKKSQA